MNENKKLLSSEATFFSPFLAIGLNSVSGGPLVHVNKTLKINIHRRRNLKSSIYKGEIYEFTKILLLSETYRRPNRDPSQTHRRPTCLIGDPSETDMPDRRPIGDQNSRSETHPRPTCLIGDLYVSSENDMPHRRPTCLIRNPSEIDMPDWRPICLIGDPLETDMPDRRPTCLSGDP